MGQEREDVGRGLGDQSYLSIFFYLSTPNTDFFLKRMVLKYALNRHILQISQEKIKEALFSLPSVAALTT